jgi:hypothetical protein
VLPNASLEVQSATDLDAGILPIAVSRGKSAFSSGTAGR